MYAGSLLSQAALQPVATRNKNFRRLILQPVAIRGIDKRLLESDGPDTGEDISMSGNRDLANTYPGESMKSSSSISALCATFALQMNFSGVIAQEAEPDMNAAGLLEEIVVTSRRTEESIQDVPISITAFSSADIEARRLADIEDIALNTPNVHFTRNLGLAIVAIRGFSDDEVVATADPLVGIYVDGVYVPRMQGALLEMMQAERVEVLKGPQGVFFGKNTVGGAINIVSQRPQGDGAGYVQGTAGTDGRLNFQASYDFGLTDNLSVMLTGMHKSRDCLLRRVNDNECVDNEDINLFRAYANYQPSDDFRAAFVLSGIYDDSHSQVYGMNVIEDPPGLFVGQYNIWRETDPTLPPFEPVGLGEPFVAEGDSPTEDLVRTETASIQMEWTLSDAVSLRSTSAFTDFESQAYIEFDVFRETTFHNEPNITLSEAFSQELILDGRALQGRFNWLAGLYYFREDAETTTNLRIPPTWATGGWSQFIYSDVESLSGFGHLSLDLSDRWSLSAGARNISEDRSFSARGDLFAFPGGNGFLAPVSNEDTWNAWTPRVSLNFAPSDDISIYGAISEGFRSGGFHGNTTVADPLRVRYDPELVTNYEIGLKASWQDRATLSSAVYFMDYTDKHFLYILATDGIPISVRGNAAAAEIVGLEADLTVAVTDNLRFDVGLANNSPEYTALRPDLLGIRLTLDSPFMYTPERTANLGVQYTAPDFAGKGEASVRLDANYKSRIYFNTVVEEIEHPLCGKYNSQDPVTKVNARFHFRPHQSDWNFTLYGHNITNEIIWERNLCIPGAGYDTPSYGQPREVGVEVRFDF